MHKEDRRRPLDGAGWAEEVAVPSRRGPVVPVELGGPCDALPRVLAGRVEIPKVMLEAREASEPARPTHNKD
eukprot:548097-Prymnesium_polylepis.1